MGAGGSNPDDSYGGMRLALCFVDCHGHPEAAGIFTAGQTRTHHSRRSLRLELTVELDREEYGDLAPTLSDHDRLMLRTSLSNQAPCIACQVTDRMNGRYTAHYISRHRPENLT